MAEIDALREIQENAEVRSSDDAVLGKVVRVHFGEDLGRRHNITQMDVADTLDTQNLELSPEEAVPDAVLEVTLSESNDTVYVPHQAVNEVSADSVVLHVDEVAAQQSDWSSPPEWVGSGGRRSEPAAADDTASGEGVPPPRD